MTRLLDLVLRQATLATELARVAALQAQASPIAPFVWKGPTPEEVIEGYIRTHEGGMSRDPDDTGNWFKGRLVGSKYGVTGATLARFRGASVTRADMEGLSIIEAIEIGFKLYFDWPDIDLLPWNPATASLLDMGWGAGPGQAAKLWQRMIGANDDGDIGPRSAEATLDYFANHGVEETARRWARVRNDFYELIIRRRPTNAKYRRGWRNRTASFLPGTPWWALWREV